MAPASLLMALLINGFIVVDRPLFGMRCISSIAGRLKNEWKYMDILRIGLYSHYEISKGFLLFVNAIVFEIESARDDLFGGCLWLFIAFLQ